MHETILSRLADDVLTCRIPSGRSSLVCGFRHGEPQPVWVAKSASRPDELLRLRQEYEALRYLAPWARGLSIPEVLEWTEDNSQAVLIQSGVPGERRKIILPAQASGAVLWRSFAAPLRWLQEFQATVPLPRPLMVAELAEQYRARLRARLQLEGAADGLAELLQAPPGAVGERSAVAAHGDFHPTNLLFRRSGISVVDWCAFGPGFPLQDVLSILVNSDYFQARARLHHPVENYHHVFFSNSPVCALVRRQIGGGAGSAAEARFLFYCFLATQICFDASTPVKDWREILRELEQHSYPGPCTLLPRWRAA